MTAVARELLDRGMLERTAECPLCGSYERVAEPSAFQSNRYIAAFARKAGVPEAAFFAALEPQRCLSCGALYFDPWLSLAGQKALYERVYPQHNLGWYTFWSVLAKPGERPREAAVYAALRRHVPGLRTYAELGCPFLGLLPYLALRRYEHGSARFWDYPGAWPGRPAAGTYPQVRGHRIDFERLGRFVAGCLDRLQLLCALPPRRLRERRLVRRAREIETRAVACYYLRQPSTTLWGAGCRSLGADCRTALEGVFRVTSLDFEDAEAARLRFDVVGICNALDHFKNPRALLRRVFDFTDHVYLEGHHSRGDLGKQHLFYVEEETLPALAKLLPFAEPVPGFAAPAGEHWYSVLLRRKT